MLAIKKIIRRADINNIKNIKVPAEFGEMIEVIILPAEERPELQEDLKYFEWDSEEDKEKRALSSLTASTIKEWKSRDEDELWR